LIKEYGKAQNFQNSPAWGWRTFLSNWYLSDPKSKLFTTSGDMKLRVRFTQYEKPDGYISGNVDDLDCVKRKAAEGALSDFSWLNKSSEMADLQVETSDGEKFKAHKLILAGAFKTFTSSPNLNLYMPLSARQLSFNSPK
jgi:hypothetical protein